MRNGERQRKRFLQEDERPYAYLFKKSKFFQAPSDQESTDTSDYTEAAADEHLREVFFFFSGSFRSIGAGTQKVVFFTVDWPTACSYKKFLSQSSLLLDNMHHIIHPLMAVSCSIL